MSEIRREMLMKVGESWETLQKALGRVPPHRMEEAGVVEAWSVKDLIGHVTSWERQAMSTVRAFQESGDADALKWTDVDGFNAVTSESNRSRSLEELRSDMEAVHDELLAFIDRLPEDVARDDQVQRRVRVDGYEHYAEHTKHILKWLGNASAGQVTI
ncbi:MAG: ClbS/DfsB family four-helix bundle protein [Chloroflexi bacterium]|nr:ClbS/DfsB family four-helix bundle protein [Chloroflexota bacterium]